MCHPMSYHIHSNKCSGRTFGRLVLICLKFVARIDSKMNDLGHFQANRSHIEFGM